jgi:hypothetical protein
MSNYNYKGTPITSIIQTIDQGATLNLAQTYNTSITYVRATSEYQKITSPLNYSVNDTDLIGLHAAPGIGENIGPAIGLSGSTASIVSESPTSGTIDIPAWANHYKFYVHTKSGNAGSAGAAGARGIPGLPGAVGLAGQAGHAYNCSTGQAKRNRDAGPGGPGGFGGPGGPGGFGGAGGAAGRGIKYFTNNYIPKPNDAGNRISYNFSENSVNVSISNSVSFTANAGTPGNSGAQGAQGAQGSQGAAGGRGNNGSNTCGGNNGSIGGQGAQGAAGAQGAQGARGTDGTQGDITVNSSDISAGTKEISTDTNNRFEIYYFTT